jgi:hypothetical protein
MAEYVKYNGTEIAIGTGESLRYLSYTKFAAALNADLLRQVEGNQGPKNDAMANSGYRFRFPFPDEDHLRFGDISGKEYVRGVPLESKKTVQIKTKKGKHL